MNAMTESPFDGSDITDLLSKALTSDTENRELITPITMRKLSENISIHRIGNLKIRYYSVSPVSP